jgi:hypothetical protein
MPKTIAQTLLMSISKNKVKIILGPEVARETDEVSILADIINH